ncbi:hypothetical protein BYT27DRAFT_7196676 [Phlegmacium glaucopus]|nr:hypothetical protein BYT27DRAFT_7196676 [Phlegmacium glaucopus]
MYCQEGILDVRPDLRQPTQNYLRAVLRPPPSRFSIDPFLATSKSNGKYHHGMHISSNNQGDRTSISSRRSLSEYDIWRSWDDCLWFQQSLEVEYERAAREKKMRLMQGKGVKGFNGLYKQDMASSWESLPPGPNPKSVAQDIHQHLPTLTRRGTLFRASQATIDQRQAELTGLIEALFSDSMPALIKEIRVSIIVSDFFGYWRRDSEYAEESQKAKTAPRNSVTSSVFSSYFSGSHPNLPSSDTSPRNSPSKTPHKRSQPSVTPRPLSSISLTEISEEPRYPRGSPRTSRTRTHSTSSDSSAHSDSSSDTSLSSSSGAAIAEEVPIVFGHNPLNPCDRSNSILEVLPEERERETFSKPLEAWRPRASTIERKANRSYSIFGLSLKESLFLADKSGDRAVRESWQTTDSQDSTANDLLDGLGLILPHPIKEQKFRASIASVSTFMTTNSADAVIPPTPQTATPCHPRSLASSTNVSAPLSLSDVDVYSDDDDYSVRGAPNSFVHECSETPIGDFSFPDSPSSTRTAFNRPPSPAYSALSSSMASTTTTSSSPVDSVSIKAIHNTSIILLRVSRGIGLADVRQRLYNKFIGQEGIPLSEAYNIAFVPPNPALTGTHLQSASVTSANRMDAQLITLESDWEQIVTSLQGNKITLRILDIPTA